MPLMLGERNKSERSMLPVSWKIPRSHCAIEPRECVLEEERAVANGTKRVARVERTWTYPECEKKQWEGAFLLLYFAIVFRAATSVSVGF